MKKLFILLALLACTQEPDVITVELPPFPEFPELPAPRPDTVVVQGDTVFIHTFVFVPCFFIERIHKWECEFPDTP